MNKNWILTFTSIGIVITIIMVIATQTTGIGITKETTIQAQISKLTFNEYVEFSDIIILGTVETLETKLVDVSYTSTPIEGYGEPIFYEEYQPFRFVTLTVEENYKDVTGQISDTFTFKAFGDGIGERNGEQISFSIPGLIDYPIGERALFFISDTDWGWFVNGYTQKFYINDDNTIHSLFNKETGFEEPMDLELAKERIRLVLERQSIIENYLDTQEAQESIDRIRQELVEESVFLANERTVPTIVAGKLKQMYDSGKDLSINKEEITTQIVNSWKQSNEFSPGKGELELSSSTQT